MNYFRRILFIFCLAAATFSGAPCFADTGVTINPSVAVPGTTVRLSHLFVGVPPEIDRDIAQAPPPCKPAIYDETVLQKLAKTYRLDWKKQGDIDHVSVASSCTRLSTDAVRDAVAAKLKEDPSLKKLNIEVVFDRRSLEIELPTDDAPEISFDDFFYDPATKQFRATLVAPTPRGAYTYPIKGHTLIKRGVPVLAHRLEANVVIGANDLDWIELSEERITPDVVTEQSQLIGREVRRDMSEGSVLRSRDIMPSRLVQRGSIVTMKIQTPYILITAQGKAQQDGAEGETIRVVNTQSNRVIEGVVVAPGVVEIRVPRKVALAE